MKPPSAHLEDRCGRQQQLRHVRQVGQLAQRLADALRLLVQPVRCRRDVRQWQLPGLLQDADLRSGDGGEV